MGHLNNIKCIIAKNTNKKLKKEINRKLRLTTYKNG